MLVDFLSCMRGRDGSSCLSYSVSPRKLVLSRVSEKEPSVDVDLSSDGFSSLVFFFGLFSRLVFFVVSPLLLGLFSMDTLEMTAR